MPDFHVPFSMEEEEEEFKLPLIDVLSSVADRFGIFQFDTEPQHVPFSMEEGFLIEEETPEEVDIADYVTPRPDELYEGFERTGELDFTIETDAPSRPRSAMPAGPPREGPSVATEHDVMSGPIGDFTRWLIGDYGMPREEAEQQIEVLGTMGGEVPGIEELMPMDRELTQAERSFLGLPTLVGGRIQAFLQNTLNMPGDVAEGLGRLIDSELLRETGEAWRTGDKIEDLTEELGLNVFELKNYTDELAQQRLLDAETAGTATEIFENLGQTGANLAALMLSMKFMNIPMTGKGQVAADFEGMTRTRQMNEHLIRMGASGFAMTEGDIKDRFLGMAMRVGYNITPYIVQDAAGMTGLAAVATDFGLNALLTSHQYRKAYEKAGGLNEEFFVMAIPQMATDLAMAWRTRGLPENVALERYGEEMVGTLNEHYGIPIERANEAFLEARDMVKAVERGEYDIKDRADDIVREMDLTQQQIKVLFEESYPQLSTVGRQEFIRNLLDDYYHGEIKSEVIRDIEGSIEERINEARELEGQIDRLSDTELSQERGQELVERHAELMEDAERLEMERQEVILGERTPAPEEVRVEEPVDRPEEDIEVRPDEPERPAEGPDITRAERDERYRTGEFVEPGQPRPEGVPMEDWLERLENTFRNDPYLDSQDWAKLEDKVKRYRNLIERHKPADADITQEKYVQLTEEFNALFERAESEGLELELDDFDRPEITADNARERYEQSIAELQGRIENFVTDRYVSELMEQTRARKEELEEVDRPSSSEQLEYRILQERVGEADIDDIMDNIHVIDSSARDLYGSERERYDMARQIIEKAGEEVEEFTIDTPAGELSLRNDTQVIVDILNKFGIRDRSDVLAPEVVETARPNIEEFNIERDDYFVRFDRDDESHFFEPIKAKPFTIEGAEHLDLFRFKPNQQMPGFPITGDKTNWHIVEAKTGITWMTARTIDEAARELKEQIDNVGFDRIESRILEMEEQHGSTPRYTGAEPDEIGVIEPDTMYSVQRDMSGQETDIGGEQPTEPVRTREAASFLNRVKREPGEEPERTTGERPLDRTVNRQEIEEYINIDENLPAYKWGKLLTSRAEGQYNTLSEVMRLRNYKGYEITAHEVGHHLKEVLDLNVGKHGDELAKLLRDEGLAESYRRELHFEEGSAEFFKYFFTEPGTAALKAPRYYAHLQERLNLNPEVDKSVRELQDMILTYVNQSEGERVGAATARRETETRDLLTFREKFEQKFIADDKVLRKALEMAGVDWKNIDILKNPIKLKRLHTSVGDKVSSFLLNKTLNANLQPEMPPLIDILSRVRDDLGRGEEVGDYTKWHLARHAIEREARYIARQVERESPDYAEEIRDAVREEDIGFLETVLRDNPNLAGQATGIAAEDIITVSRDYEKEHFYDVAKDIKSYRDNLVDYLESRDMLDTESAEAIKDAYSFYMPLYRIFGGEESDFNTTAGNKYVNLPQPLKQAYGSSRIIQDPIMSLIRDTSYIIRTADQNRIALNFIDGVLGEPGARKETQGWIAEEVRLPMESHQVVLEQIRDTLKDAGITDDVLEDADLNQYAKFFETRQYASYKESRENVVLVRRDGEVEAYQVHPDLYKTLNSSTTQMSGVEKALLAPVRFTANMFKAGAVLDVRFWINNLGRDEVRKMVYAEDGWEKLKLFSSVIKGMSSLTGFDRTETDAMFRSAGGSRGGMFGAMQTYDDPGAVHKLFAKKEFTAGSLNPYNIASKASLWTEDVRRKGFFLEMLGDKNINDMSPEEWERALMESGYHARGGILEDYGIKGEWSRELNRYIPFLSAGVTGVRHLYEMADDPMFWVKAFTFVTVPEILLWYHNKDEEAYQELSPFQKMFRYNYVNEEGGLISFPRPFALGYLFGGIPAAILNYQYEKDPEHLTDMLKQSVRFGAPNYAPHHLLPYLETAFNRRWETGSEIVPRHEQMLDPRKQYSEFTSEPAKVLGDLLGMSPRKIDHVLRGQFTSVYRTFDQTVNFAIGAQDFQETVGSVLGVYNEPFTFPYSVSKVYNMSREAESTVADYRDDILRLETPKISQEEAAQAFADKARYGSATNMMNEIGRVETLIRTEELFTEDKREAHLTYLNIMKTNIARMALGRDIIDPERYIDADIIDETDDMLDEETSPEW